jgi:hypothetical protein
MNLYKENVMSRLCVFLCLSMILIVSLSCQKSENPVNSISPTQANQTSLKKVYESDLYMPDAIPDVVNTRALEISSKFGYENIRILGVSKTQKPVFHILYFKDNLLGLKAFTLELNDAETRIIIEEEVCVPYDASELQKPLDDYKCWKLATIYSGSNYSGNSFQFSQATTTYGWYHKVIDCLATTYVCCNGTYNANFNNAISSSYWCDDYYSPDGRIARAIALSAWKDCPKWGDKVVFGDEDWRKDTRFSETAQWGTVCRQTILAPSWAAASFDDCASSLDMYYRVYTPTSCD